jgi:hypothetical protein
MPDAQWITDYDRYCNLFYQCIDPEEVEEYEEFEKEEDL